MENHLLYHKSKHYFFMIFGFKIRLVNSFTTSFKFCKVIYESINRKSPGKAYV